MPFAMRDGVRLFWRLDGVAERPPLVLLNSIGCDLSVWDRLVPLLLPSFRVLRMDARGHGASDAPTGDYTLDDLAKDVAAVMDAAGLARAAICGISLGGMVAMTLALDAPDRLTALILVCTSATIDPEAWRTRIETVRAKGLAAIVDIALDRFFSPGFRRQHPDTIGTVRAGLLGMSATGYAGCGAAIRDMNLALRLPSIAAPCLVVAGTKDVSMPFEGHSDAIAAAIPGAQVAMLDAAHLACLEAPEALAAGIRIFLLLPPSANLEAEDTLFQAGLANRRQVLGDAWVDRSLAKRTSFNADFQAMITRIAWHEIWGRPGLDHRTRRLLVIAITAALGRWEEFKLHVTSGLDAEGFSIEELKETLMQTAIYAGVPAANTAFAEAGEILRARDQRGS